MSTVLSPERSPANLLGPGLLAAVLCSVALACLQSVYGGMSQEMPFSGTALLVFSGILGAFGGFFTVLLQAVLIWVYGKAWPSVEAGFVRTLAVVAFALGITFALQFALVGTELALTGEAPAQTAANLSRYLGPGSVSFDPVSLVTIAIVYVGIRRYLGYGAWSAGILAVLMMIVNVATGMAA